MSEDRERKGSGKAPAGRVPPHDLQAEESLLGASLLSITALETLTTRLAPEDFYKPTHATIAAVLMQAYAEGWPADPVTVANELKRQGLLEQIGGASTLVSLQAGTPATSNAARYASIVADHATLRKVLGVAGDLAEQAYGLGDTSAILNRAQAALGDVAGRNGAGSYSTLETPDVGALIDGGLVMEEADFLTRTDGRALLYAGKMHVFQAEPSAGKGWLALVAAAEILNMGGAAIYLDYEDTAAGVIGRLLALGADPSVVRARFAYVQPVDAMGVLELAELRRLMDTLNPDLVVIDSFIESATREGFDEDKAPQVIAWFEKLPKWIARTGATVIILDHVPKDKEKQGRWARGSGAKLGAVDGATYNIKVQRSFSRHREGTLKIIVAKDRPGGVGAIGDVAAIAHVEPKADGERVIIRLDVDTGERSTGDTWKPTRLMAKVSAELERANTPLSSTALKSLVHSDKPKLVAEAIARLITEGYIVEAKLGRAKVLRLVKAYHSADDEPPPAEEPPPGLFEDDDNITRGPWPDPNEEF